jgi:hypothetical protein
MKVGQSRGADWLVVEFFVLLHNSQRLNEYLDMLHGSRATEFTFSLKGSFST